MVYHFFYPFVVKLLNTNIFPPFHLITKHFLFLSVFLFSLGINLSSFNKRIFARINYNLLYHKEEKTSHNDKKKYFYNTVCFLNLNIFFFFKWSEIPFYSEEWLWHIEVLLEKCYLKTLSKRKVTQKEKEKFHPTSITFLFLSYLSFSLYLFLFTYLLPPKFWEDVIFSKLKMFSEKLP